MYDRVKVADTTKPLTEAHHGLLTDLLIFGSNGALTCRLAGWKRTSWATNRMRTLAKRGLVQRHETNAERWYITPAGRALIASKDAAHG